MVQVGIYLSAMLVLGLLCLCLLVRIQAWLIFSSLVHVYVCAFRAAGGWRKKTSMETSATDHATIGNCNSRVWSHTLLETCLVHDKHGHNNCVFMKKTPKAIFLHQFYYFCVCQLCQKYVVSWFWFVIVTAIHKNRKCTQQ